MQRLVLSVTFCLILMNSPFIRAQTSKVAAENVPVVIQKTAQTSTPATYKGRQTMVGSGGGITGFFSTYYLLDNGQLFGQSSRDTTFTFIGQQTVANTKTVFEVVETKCKIKTTRFYKPGNMYRFVKWRKGKLSYIVTWSPGDKTIPANYPKFYESFMAMIPFSSRVK